MFRCVAIVALLTILSPAAARTQEADEWFARDKALHFGVSAGVTMVVYAGVSLKTDHHQRTSRLAAATFGLGVGVGKEVYDAFGPGDASWKDLTWDVIGVVTGVLVATAIEWALLNL
jgi:putative lipoprotein